MYTHLDGDKPSTYTGFNYGDLGFASLTPFKPVYVLRMPENMISYIIVNEVNVNLAKLRNTDKGDVLNRNGSALSELLKGSWSLKRFTFGHFK